MSHFVCFYYGNTGSSWLVETLGTSPEVLVPGFEPLERWGFDVPDDQKFAWIRNAYTPPDADDAERWDAWVAGLREAPSAAKVDPVLGFTSVGFKMTFWAVDDREALVDTVAALPVKAILLTRENRIKHALSMYRYREEDKSQFNRKGHRPPSEVSYPKFHFWLRESVRAQEQALEFEQLVRSRFGDDRVTNVTYEQFVTSDGKRETIDRMAGFLELDRSRISDGSFEKATPDDLRSALVNYRGLRRRYRNTEFAKFFEE